MFHNPLRAPSVFIVLIGVATIVQLCGQLAYSSSSSSSSSSNYDPEQQDGIPILSARSLAPRPADDWLNYDDEQQERTVDYRAAPSQRRNTDADLDDNLEDEEEDEYKSGSNKHEHIEPSYGESRRSAKDADEIENFFDRHLGPPEEAATGGSGEATSEVPIVHQFPGASSQDDEDDDMYETAASGPLSTIIHNLFAGTHKRPMATLQAEATATADEQHQQLGANAITASQTKPGSTADNSPVATTTTTAAAAIPPSTTKVVAQQQQQQQQHQSPATAAIKHFASPLASLLMPIAQSTSLIGGYESSSHLSAGGPSLSISPNDANIDAGGGGAGQVQEIYIGRRPHVAQLLKASASKNLGQQYDAGASAAHVWRINLPITTRPTQPEAATATTSEQPTGGVYATQMMSVNQQLDEQPRVAYGNAPISDYSHYPTAASYAHQREQSPINGGADNDDEQTVTYNLSFGPTQASDGSLDETQTQSNSDEPTSQHETAGGANYNTANVNYPRQAFASYQSRDPMQRFRGSSASSSRRKNTRDQEKNQYRPQAMSNRYQQPASSSAAFRQPTTGQMAALMMQQEYQQQMQRLRQAPHYGARYHRDPEYQTADGVNAATARAKQQQRAYRPANDAETDAEASTENQLERQQLLASLDTQIKASPLYRRRGNNGQQAPMMVVASNQRQQLKTPTAFKDKHRLGADDDLVSYNSYHSEVDPYRAITTSSKMIKYPAEQVAASLQLQQQQQHFDVGHHGTTLNSNEDDGGRQLAAPTSEQQRQQLGTFGVDHTGTPLSTGPLGNLDPSFHQHQMVPMLGDQAMSIVHGGDILRNNNNNNNTTNESINHQQQQQQLLLQQQQQRQQQRQSRVRRDDSEERDTDDDDGVWVDDDEDDDGGRQQSSDLNETTAQDAPSDEETEDDTLDGNGAATQMDRPGIIGGPHSYELSPNDLMIYHG